MLTAAKSKCWDMLCCLLRCRDTEKGLDCDRTYIRVDGFERDTLIQNQVKQNNPTFRTW